MIEIFHFLEVQSAKWVHSIFRWRKRMNSLGILPILEKGWSKSTEYIYLNLIKSGILSKTQEIHILMSLFLHNFIIIFYYHIKRLFIISNFIKIHKVIGIRIYMISL